jgi:hypothetical protein
MKKEELELILGVVAQRAVELSDSQYASVGIKAPVDLLSELGFVEVRLVKPTKAAITVVDCGNSQLVIRGDDEALRFNNNKVECVSVANSTAVFSFIRPNKTTALTCLPLEVLYVMQGKTPEWFAKQYNKYMF